MTGIEVNAADAAEEERKHRIRGGAFLGLVAGVSALFGFSKTLSNAKKEDAEIIKKGGRQAVLLLDEGSSLALRAFGWGSLYAFLGTGTICYGIWKFSGAQNFKEFREKMGEKLPRISKDGPPTSRTEFDGLTDLMKYLSTWRSEKDKE